jgi:hypothetical protein
VDESPYEDLGKLAHDTVIKTMIEGEATHKGDEWKRRSAEEHLMHALQHIMEATSGCTNEPHVAHALTRCAIAQYLSQNTQKEELK